MFLNAERKSIIVKIPIHAFARLLLAAGVLASGNTSAAPQRLECTLTETDAESAVEHRSITIVFDEDAATMKLQVDSRTRNLSNVSISMTSMSGSEADMTIGVSRSPWRVVYVTAPVMRGDVARAVTATGTVNPVLTVIVGSYVSGVIRDQYCDFNTRVRVGQLCAKIEVDKAVIQQDEAALDTAQASLELSQESYKEGQASFVQVLQAQRLFGQARLGYAQAKSQRYLDTAQLFEAMGGAWRDWKDPAMR